MRISNKLTPAAAALLAACLGGCEHASRTQRPAATATVPAAAPAPAAAAAPETAPETAAAPASALVTPKQPAKAKPKLKPVLAKPHIMMRGGPSWRDRAEEEDRDISRLTVQTRTTK